VFDRIRNSFSLAGSSFQLLRSDKQLLLFPVLSGICSLFVLIAFLLPLAIFPDLLKGFEAQGPQGQAQVPLWVYPVAFVFYFCNYFVVIFFNSALIGCAVLRFNGQQATLGDGLRVAWSRLPQIAAWAVVSATVGLLLKMIENAHEQLGRIISGLLGTAWTIMTYFVVPVLVVEKVGPVDAVKRSVEILKQTWGEALVGNVGIGLIVFLLLLPALLLGVIGFMLLSSAPPVGIFVLVLAALYLIVWLALGPTLNGIFVAALYQYASHRTVPEGFEGAALAGAFSHK
jgi:hypothetical protein